MHVTPETQSECKKKQYFMFISSNCTSPKPARLRMTLILQRLMGIHSCDQGWWASSCRVTSASPFLIHFKGLKCGLAICVQPIPPQALKYSRL